MKGWHNPINDSTIACFTRGGRAACGGVNNGGACDCEDEDEVFVRNMRGQKREQLQLPAIINSGACASVTPTAWCPHAPVMPTKQSESGEYFRAANGEKIFNRGHKSHHHDDPRRCQERHEVHCLRRSVKGTRICLPDVPQRTQGGV